MTRDEALAFLRAHQPMPDEANLTAEVARSYEAVRLYFLGHPDPESVPLFLNAFGAGTAFGINQVVDDVLRRYPPEVVVPQLARALGSEVASVRFWCSQIAAQFPSPELVEPLAYLLMTDEDDSTRFFAAFALGRIGGPAAGAALRRARTSETDPEVSEAIAEALLDSPPRG